MLSASQLVIAALIFIAQNIAFTFVSRARNSGSILRHIIAAFFSNGFFILANCVVTAVVVAGIQGKYGKLNAVGYGLFYTVSTVIGGVLAHYIALKVEKGKGAVGANKKYAQIPVGEYIHLRDTVLALKSELISTRVGSPFRGRISFVDTFEDTLDRYTTLNGIGELNRLCADLKSVKMFVDKFKAAAPDFRPLKPKELPQYVAISHDPGVSLEKAAWKP